MVVTPRRRLLRKRQTRVRWLTREIIVVPLPAILASRRWVYAFRVAVSRGVYAYWVLPAASNRSLTGGER